MFIKLHIPPTEIMKSKQLC